MSLTIAGAGGLGADRTYDYSWSGLIASGDKGVATQIPAHVRELAIQAASDFTGSLAIQLQGSNDNVNFSQLKDISNTAISLTDTTVIRFTNPPKYIKPVATAGTGGGLGAVVSIHGSVTG